MGRQSSSFHFQPCHEYNVYLLICFVKSMVTHSSHNSYKIGMIGLLGESSEWFRSKLSSQTFSLITMLTGEMHDDSSLVNDVSIQVNVICFI